MGEGQQRGRRRGGRHDDARALAAAGRQVEAAQIWEALGAAALARGDRAEAAQCWALAGDALRRDERPAAAAAALGRALEVWAEPGPDVFGQLPQGRVEQGAAKAILAGVLLDLGRIDAAAGLAAAVAEGASSPGLRVLGLDLLSGAELARGAVEASRAAAARMAEGCPEGARPALWFREGILWRMDGGLARARGCLHRVLEAAPAGPAWAGPRASAVAELAELDLLDGNFTAAAEGFREAWGLWGEAGRASGQWRAAAGRALAQRGAGLLPNPDALDAGRELAEARGLPLLSARMLATQGALRAARGEPAAAELDRAVEVAAGCGATLLEGWARWIRRTAGIDAGDQARLEACFADDAVMGPRVALLRG